MRVRCIHMHVCAYINLTQTAIFPPTMSEYTAPELLNEKAFTRETTQEASPPDSFELRVPSWIERHTGYRDVYDDDDADTSDASDPDFIYYGLDSDYSLPDVVGFTDSSGDCSSEEEEEEEEEPGFIEECVVFEQDYVTPVKSGSGFLQSLQNLVPSKREAGFFLAGGVSFVYALVKLSQAAEAASRRTEE